MRSSRCVECDRLGYDTAALQKKYNAALDAVSATPGLDQGYTERQMDLTEASTRLFEAQRLEHVHQDRDHRLDRLANPLPDRRVSGVTDRRGIRRGGRRSGDSSDSSDHAWPDPPPIVPCSRCDGGTAGIFTSFTEDAKCTVMYVCRVCGHQIDRVW